MYFWGKTKYWWALIVVGLLMIPCGLWLWSQPTLGYEVLSMLLGWMLILFGVVQLIVSNNVKRKVRGWGWWLAGGHWFHFGGESFVQRNGVTFLLCIHIPVQGYFQSGFGICHDLYAPVLVGLSHQRSVAARSWIPVFVDAFHGHLLDCIFMCRSLPLLGYHTYPFRLFVTA